MNNHKKKILVPTDFKTPASYALQHAVRVSGVVGETIAMIHVVGSPAEIAAAQIKLETDAKEAQNKYGVLPEVLVRVGDVADEIAKAAIDINASIVIMGSASVKGKQDLSNLPTLKVITKSTVPFITIQEPPVNKRYDDIIFPIDFTVENKEKHGWISYFCDYYISKFHLIKPNVSDPELVAKVDLNMASAVRFLDEKGAKYQIYTAPGIKPYAEEVLDIAVNIRADLIVIMTTKVCDDTKFIMEPHEQTIVGYAGHIPVMCINPR
ncbi:MAG: universal stress protein [Tenuifilaceae bacterium]|jgi:nucleotide-binding universal stress UspA family protein|nr:universal stress protein [Tenuifilaceae bacterium]